MASVGVDDAHDVINVSSAEVPDAKALKITKRAEVSLNLKQGVLFIPTIGLAVLLRRGF